MKITKSGLVYQLAFMPAVFPVNCYLAEEADELTLVDTGLAFCCKRILKAAEQIGKPITRIVLTHPHSDHIGGLDLLKEYLQEAVVLVSERDSALMNGDLSLYPAEKNTPVRGGFEKNLKTKPNRLLRQGDRVGSLEVIELPGHTPGSAAFWHPEEKFLIAGDAFQVRGGFGIAGDLKITFPFPALATWDKEAAVKSAKKAAALPVETLGTGHGKLVRNAKPLMEQAVQKAEIQLEKGGR